MEVEHEHPKKDRSALLNKPFPPQEQDNPGVEKLMKPLADHGEKSYKGTGRLQDKVAIVTGGDSGIGKAICIAFAREGAHVVCAYLNEHEDAQDTYKYVTEAGRKCVLVAADISEEKGCQKIITEAVKKFDGKIDILVNNAAFQGKAVEGIEDLNYDRILYTFKTNIIAMFELTRLVLPYLQEGGSVINIGSIQAYDPSNAILDYATTKGAIVNFTKGLAPKLLERGIRVNCVAPGPVWTPLVVASFPPEKTSKFGEQVPMGRAAMPAEIAPAVVFLASKDSQYISGEVIGVTGGRHLG